MNTRDLYHLAQTLDAEHISLCYSGNISQKVLVGLAAALRSQMAPLAIDDNRLKRVFSVFVEQVQNIMRHSAGALGDSAAEPGRYGLVTFGLAGGHFFIIAGNRMISSQAQKLRATLDEIGALNKKQLLARYREQMTQLADDPRDLADWHGAGIGLLEVARHVSQPVEYSFIELDHDHSYFVMKAYI